MIYDADVISYDDVIYEREMMLSEDQENERAFCELCDTTGYVIDMLGDDDRGYICIGCDRAEQNDTYYYEMGYR